MKGAKEPPAVLKQGVILGAGLGNIAQEELEMAAKAKKNAKGARGS
jgi:hypothetical protein